MSATGITTGKRGLTLAFFGLSGVRLAGCCPEVTYRRAGQRFTWKVPLDGAAGFESRSPQHGLAVRLTVEQHARATVVQACVKNTGPQVLYLSRVAPLAVDAAGECRVGADCDWSVFRQGYQSWTGTRSFRADEVDRDPWSALLRVGLIDVHRPSLPLAGHFRSDMFTAVKNLGSEEVLLAGFLTCRAAFGAVEVWVQSGRCSRFAPTLDYDDIPVAPGAEITTEPLWLAAGTDEHELLAAYATAAGDRMQARIPPRNPTGWCSWYYYFTRITEDRITENLQALAQLRTRFACDYVQVDDGYQAAIGDWLRPNAKFPRGMARVAEQIRAAGFDAGLWTAPFIATRGSSLMTEHPDWFVRTGATGRPRFALWNPVWGVLGTCYALDTTHPDVLAWLRETFRRIAGEWGYRILKLDFLFAAALPGRRYDRHATRAMALRRGLEAIRAGAGDDAFLIGCGCPLGPAIGVVDAMRIGPDVAPFWSNALSRGPQRDLHGLATKHAIRNTLTRAFLHRRWWRNDPDCLMVRDRKTRLNEDEVRSLATAIAVTDGMLVLSDRVEQLPATRLEMLDRTLELAGGVAEVVDLMRSDVPELVVTRAAHRTVVAIFNFADHPSAKTVDLGPLVPGAAQLDSLVEWWTGARVPIVAGRAELGTLPPHGCRVLVVPRHNGDDVRAPAPPSGPPR